MKMVKRFLAVLGVALTGGSVMAADPTNATEVITALQGAATGYVSAGMTAVAVVILGMFGLFAIYVVARWIKRAIGGR